MASHTLPQQSTPFRPEAPAPSRTLWEEVQRILAPIASLKLTVALFAMAIFIILAGTLAQTDKDIWEVIDQYFRFRLDRFFSTSFPYFHLSEGFARIDLQIFFPASFFPSQPQVPGWFPFPKGWMIGAVMFANLAAAHLVRFKVQASGTRLLAGLLTILLGMGVTWAVIVSGSNKDGLEGVPMFSWSTLWKGFVGGLVVIWLTGLYGLFTLDRTRVIERWLLGTWSLGLGVLLASMFYFGEEMALGDSSMRILWQLIKGGAAGLVLLAGCWLVFRKRAGVVLLHAGIGLMMLSELLVGTQAKEAQMHIQEGQTVNYVQDIRTLELAVVDTQADPDYDHEVVVPQSMLKVSTPEQKHVIQHAELPFDVEVVKYLQNSQMRGITPGDENLATEGAGLHQIPDPRRPGAGTDAGGDIDLSAAYVKLLEKGTGKPLGTWLVGLELLPQPVEVGDSTYDLSLRFQREYKPYTMHLVDVRFDKYIGTAKAKNYSSELRLVDPTRSVDRPVRIWMNNPLRFAGETFYQSSVSADEKSTGLQVVRNTGWMIPYVACMLVAVGMLAHFSISLLRFLNRRDSALGNVESASLPASEGKKPRKIRAETMPPNRVAQWFPVLLVAIFAVWVASKARVPRAPDGQMNLTEFGKLPIVYEGRVKPFDTLARNSLRIISTKQEFVDNDGNKQPAIRWLLDVITGSREATAHKVFKIDNPEVQQLLGLERRKGHLYSVDELRPKIAEFERQAELAHKLDQKSLSAFQKKILELDRQIRAFMLLTAAFDQARIRTDNFENVRRDLMEARVREESLARMQPPLAVPPEKPGEEWRPYMSAWTAAWLQNIQGEQPNPATISLNAILVAYAQKDAAAFNREVAEYQQALAGSPPENYSPRKSGFESYFNHLEPFYLCLVLYLIAFVLAALAWLGWSGPLNRAAFWLMMFTLLVHTFAIVARIYISGRPPVTNLYGTALFIGWGCVVLGLLLEAIYRLGIGNIVASVCGFGTLLIAHLLTTMVPDHRGDTFVVLEAVLDTQIWLATHVVLINLGYATTFLAGALGAIYVIFGVATPSLTKDVGKELARMIYGTVCFSIFFSFVGTVLGGLWADDSWGRFWGWDPKENGALIIVLWNALVLHARWGGLIKDRGLAVLAVAGNICTAWSWFGVNELGAGLHSYGFTEGVALALGIFVATQLMIIALGLLPRSTWWSRPEAAT
jgi:ABC-type transport system involved in cytochrome c biogenesis permease subunit